MVPFMVLDKDLFSCQGFVNETKKYTWSNEVRSVEDDQLVIRYFDDNKTVYATGTYNDLVAQKLVKGNGLPGFTRCMYVLFADGRLGHISLAGAAFSSWIDLENQGAHKFENHFVVFNGSKAMVQGDTDFYSPQFAFGDEVPEDFYNRAVEADKTVQDYLDKYFKVDKTKTPEYDRDDQKNSSTDSWAMIELTDGRSLGEMALNELHEVKQDLEDAKQEDSSLYQYVCRGVYEHQQKQKSDNAPQEKATPEMAEPTQQEDPGGFAPKQDPPIDPTNIFLGKKETPDESWKELEAPNGMKLGELSNDQLEASKKVLDDQPNLKEQYSEIYKGIVTGLNQLNG